VSAGRASRKEWGWHPLTDEWADRIVDQAEVSPGELVLDLGAGTGALTAPLLARGARVVAVELHPGRVASLRARFGSDIVVVRADLASLRLPRHPFRVVANPPFVGAAQLLARLLSSDRLVAADVVVPRAVARRLVATPRGRHARLYSLTEGMPLPRVAFRPPPKVDARVLRVRRR